MANNPFLLVMSEHLFGHLEHKNPSIVSDFLDTSKDGATILVEVDKQQKDEYSAISCCLIENIIFNFHPQLN